jgi:hypothetical protein
MNLTEGVKPILCDEPKFEFRTKICPHLISVSNCCNLDYFRCRCSHVGNLYVKTKI